jgi:very-short-patch-repair endonuclease
MSEKQEYDQRRAESLRRRGIHIVRVGNERVLEDTQRVLLEIWQALLAGPRPSPPAPLPEGEGTQTQ